MEENVELEGLAVVLVDLGRPELVVAMGVRPRRADCRAWAPCQDGCCALVLRTPGVGLLLERSCEGEGKRPLIDTAHTSEEAVVKSWGVGGVESVQAVLGLYFDIALTPLSRSKPARSWQQAFPRF